MRVFLVCLFLGTFLLVISCGSPAFSLRGNDDFGLLKKETTIFKVKNASNKSNFIICADMKDALLSNENMKMYSYSLSDLDYAILYDDIKLAKLELDKVKADVWHAVTGNIKKFIDLI